MAKKPVKPLPPPTAQMLKFVNEYVVDFNGARAATRAGYSPKSARVTASVLLARDDIAELVRKKQEALSKKTGVTAENVIREVARMAFSDIRRAFARDGALLPIHEIDDDTAAAIASIEVEALFEGQGKDREQVGYTHKVKLWDKPAATEKLMKHLGQYKVDNEQKKDSLAELLAAIAARNSRLPIKEDGQ